MKLLKLLHYIYKNSISPIFMTLFGVKCKYKVTCSTYTVNMIEKYGIIKGSQKGFKRFLTCR